MKNTIAQITLHEITLVSGGVEAASSEQAQNNERAPRENKPLPDNCDHGVLHACLAKCRIVSSGSRKNAFPSCEIGCRDKYCPEANGDGVKSL